MSWYLIDTLLIEMSYMGMWPVKKTRQNVKIFDRHFLIEMSCMSTWPAKRLDKMLRYLINTL